MPYCQFYRPGLQPAAMEWLESELAWHDYGLLCHHINPIAHFSAWPLIDNDGLFVFLSQAIEILYFRFRMFGEPIFTGNSVSIHKINQTFFTESLST